MKIFLGATFLISLSFNSIVWASENHVANLISLDEQTFVKIYNSSDGVETIQLFKIEGNKINMVDAILIDEKKVNFKPSFEYQRLKIEQIKQQ